MSIRQWVELNSARLRAWRIITLPVAYLLLAMAAYSVLGGAFVFLAGVEKSTARYYGLTPDLLWVLFGNLNLMLPAFLAWSVGEYLQFLINGSSRPGRTERLLPVALVAISVIPLGTWLFSTLRFPFETGIEGPVGFPFGTFLYGTFPKLAGAAASIGLAMIVARLTLLVEEEQVTV